MSAIIKASGLRKEFQVKKQVITAVDDVSLEVPEGSVCGIIGYSGAGKSTLVRLFNALETLTAGKLEVAGRTVKPGMKESQLRGLRKDTAMVFQQFNLLNSRTIAGNVAYPLKIAGWPKERRDARVQELLEFVGISEQARKYPAQLSGGQKQRVGIARALATSPKLLLADEATSALDPETTGEVLKLLARVNRELGITIVVITHEMDVVRQICNQVIVMENGRVVENGDVYDIFSYPKHRATQGFVSTAMPRFPDAEVMARIQAEHGDDIVTVGVREPGHSSKEIFEIFSRHRVGATVVFGGISEITKRRIGNLTLALEGDAASIAAALDEIDAQKIPLRRHQLNVANPALSATTPQPQASQSPETPQAPYFPNGGN